MTRKQVGIIIVRACVRVCVCACVRACIPLHENN